MNEVAYRKEEDAEHATQARMIFRSTWKMCAWPMVVLNTESEPLSTLPPATLLVVLKGTECHTNGKEYGMPSMLGLHPLVCP